MQIKLLVEGGAMQPGPALSQKLGPAGINISQVISKVNEVTKGFKGLKVPVELDVDLGTKEFEIKVFSPPVSELLKKELGLEKGSAEQLKIAAGNASIEQIISIAKTKMPNLLAKDLKAAVKSIIGTCTSLGILVENNFYFRCQDYAEKRNVNKQSYEFNIFGTQPLVIDSIKPSDETIKDASDPVKVTIEVETSAGYNEGESICYYSEVEDDDEYIMFFETNSYKHVQDLYLAEGDYEYFIKCIDLGGNADTGQINFEVESDTTAPIIVRAFKEENYLKIITNEKAECIYDVQSCNYLFKDGLGMTVVDDTSHFTDWNPKSILYIKCKDEFGNEPLPSSCSMIIRGFENYEE